MSDSPIHLAFEAGTLVLTGGTPALLDTLPGVTFDGRTGVHRAEGRAYRALVEHLRAQKIEYKDEARTYDLTPWPLRISRDPFPHQREAVAVWWKGTEARKAKLAAPNNRPVRWSPPSNRPRRGTGGTRS